MSLDVLVAWPAAILTAAALLINRRDASQPCSPYLAGGRTGCECTRASLEVFVLWASAAGALAVVLAVIGTDIWVYVDSKAAMKRGTPVVFSAGGVTWETPGAWALGCLVLFIVIVPLYLTLRDEAR